MKETTLALGVFLSLIIIAIESKKIVFDTTRVPDEGVCIDDAELGVPNRVCGAQALMFAEYVAGDIFIIQSGTTLDWQAINPLIENTPHFNFQGLDSSTPGSFSIIKNFRYLASFDACSITFTNIRFEEHSPGAAQSLLFSSSNKQHIRFFKCHFVYNNADILFAISNHVELTLVDCIIECKRFIELSSATAITNGAGAFISTGEGSINVISSLFRAMGISIVVPVTIVSVLLDSATAKYAINFVKCNFLPDTYFAYDPLMKINTIGSGIDVPFFFKENTIEIHRTQDKGFIEFQSEPNKKLHAIIAGNSIETTVTSIALFNFNNVGFLDLLDSFNEYYYLFAPAAHIVAKADKDVKALLRKGYIDEFDGPPLQITVESKDGSTSCIEISEYELDSLANPAGVQVKDTGTGQANLFLNKVVGMKTLNIADVTVIDVNGGNANVNTALLSANNDLTLAGITSSNVALGSIFGDCQRANFQEYLLNFDVPIAGFDQFTGPGTINVFDNDGGGNNKKITGVTPMSLGNSYNSISIVDPNVGTIELKNDGVPPSPATVDDFYYYLAETPYGARTAGKAFQIDTIKTMTIAYANGIITMTHNFVTGPTTRIKLLAVYSENGLNRLEVIRYTVQLGISPYDYSATFPTPQNYKIHVRVQTKNNFFSFFSQVFVVTVVGTINLDLSVSNPSVVQENKPFTIGYTQTVTNIAPANNIELKFEKGANSITLCSKAGSIGVAALSCSDLLLTKPYIGDVTLVLSYAGDASIPAVSISTAIIVSTVCSLEVIPPAGVDSNKIITNEGIYTFASKVICPNEFKSGATITLKSSLEAQPFCISTLEPTGKESIVVCADVTFKTAGAMQMVATFSGNNYHPSVSASIAWKASSKPKGQKSDLTKSKYAYGEPIPLSYIITYDKGIILSSTIKGIFQIRAEKCETFGVVKQLPTSQDLVFACIIILNSNNAQTSKRAISATLSQETAVIEIEGSDATTPVSATQTIELFSIGVIALRQVSYFPSNIITLSSDSSNLIGFYGCVSLFSLSSCVQITAVPVNWDFNWQSAAITPTQGTQQATIQIFNNPSSSILLASNEAAVSFCLYEGCIACDATRCLACESGKLLSISQTSCVTACGTNQIVQSGKCACKAATTISATFECIATCTFGCKTCTGLGLAIASDKCQLCDNTKNFVLSSDGTSCVSSCKLFEEVKLISNQLQCQPKQEAMSGPINNNNNNNPPANVLQSPNNNNANNNNNNNAAQVPNTVQEFGPQAQAGNNAATTTVVQQSNGITTPEQREAQNKLFVEKLLAVLKVIFKEFEENKNNPPFTEEEQDQIDTDYISDLDADNEVDVDTKVILRCNGATCSNGACVSSSLECTANEEEGETENEENAQTEPKTSRQIYVVGINQDIFTISSFDTKSIGTAAAFELPPNLPENSFFSATQTAQPNIDGIASGVFTLKYGIDDELQPSATFTLPINVVLVADLPKSAELDKIEIRILSDGKWIVDETVKNVEIIARVPNSINSRNELMFIRYDVFHLTSFAVFFSGSANGGSDDSDSLTLVYMILTPVTMATALCCSILFILVVLFTPLRGHILSVDKKRLGKLRAARLRKSQRNRMGLATFGNNNVEIDDVSNSSAT